MKFDKAMLDDYERLQEIVKCAILHSKGIRHKDIAKALDISPSRVAKNTGIAVEKGLIKVKVYPPPELKVAENIQKTYKLREALVFPIGIAEEITNMLAEIAAVYLEKSLDDTRGNIKRIAIGPGRTTLTLVRALSDKRRPEVKVGSTTYPTPKETFLASNILIGIPAWKWECELYRFDHNMPSEKQKDYADIIILGIEAAADMEDVTALVLSSYLDNATLERELHNLAASGGTCIINYQPIDADGKTLDWDLSVYKEVLKPTVLELDLIKEMAQNAKKMVICVAGGKDKADAIKAGLRGGYFNVLITDYETAKLLEIQ